MDLVGSVHVISASKWHIQRLTIWRLYLFESIYFVIIYILCVVPCCACALQSQSLYGKILRQLNEFIVNRSRPNKNNKIGIFNLQLCTIKKTIKTTILYGVYKWRLFTLCYVYSKSKYNLITIIIIILTSVRLHLARRCCCGRPHSVSLSGCLFIDHITASTAKCN